MSSKMKRKNQLSAQTLEKVAKYLPENNADKPEGYPIAFSEFCTWTNVREVTINAIKRSQQRSYKIYLENEDCIRAQEYSFYLKFYKYPEARRYPPCCHIKSNENCSKEQCQLIFSCSKNAEVAKRFPVSFEVFCKYTNYDEILESAVKSLKHKIDKNSTEWQTYAHKLYKEFYTNQEKRKKFNIRIKACTKSFKEQLLKYAENAEETKEAEKSHESQNTVITEAPNRANCLDTINEVEEPMPKRPRLVSQRDNQTNIEEANRDDFPVDYDTFLMHTNVKDVAERYLKKSDPFPKSLDVVELTKKLFVEFYSKSRYDNALLNELFVRHYYADIINSYSDTQLSMDAHASERNRQNDILGAWCIKIPKTKEFGQKYLNIYDNGDMHHNNNNDSHCISSNEHVGTKQKVQIQSVEIIQPAIVESNTFPSALNESASNSLGGSADPQKTNTDNNVDDIRTTVPENNQSQRSESPNKEKEQDHNGSGEQISEVTQSNQSEDYNCETLQSQNTQKPESNNDPTTNTPEPVLSDDELLQNVARIHGYQNIDVNESEINQSLNQYESDDQVLSNAINLPQLGESKESDQNTQTQLVETALHPKRNETVTPNETDESSETTSVHIEMPKSPDQNTNNTVEKEPAAVRTEEQIQLLNQGTQAQIEQETTDTSQQQEADSNKTNELNIQESAVSGDLVEPTEAEQNQSSPPDRSFNEIVWHYPVSFTNFCKYAKLQDVVEKIRKKRAKKNSQKNYGTTWMNIAREVYENFYTDPAKRDEYAISFKPLPDVKRKKFFQFASKIENKVMEKIATQSDRSIHKGKSATLKSTAKPCKSAPSEKEKMKVIEEEEDTKDDMRSTMDSVELALKEIFEGKDSDSSGTEDNSKSVPAEKSLISMSDVNSQAISEERIALGQKEMNVPPSYVESPLMGREIAQLNSESLLQVSSLCNSTNLEETLSDNFIDMPNTQQQHESISNDHTTTLTQCDPLNETIFRPSDQIQSNKQSLASRILMEELATSTTGNSTDDMDIKDLVHKKAFPLKNLNFILDDSEDDFVVKEIIEEPVLLNDSQDDTISNFSPDREILKNLVNQLPSSSQDCCTSEIERGDDESFVCPEGQRLPSTLSSERSGNTTIPPVENTSSNTHCEGAPLNENIASKDCNPPPPPPKSQNENKITAAGKPKRANFRVVKSKNLAYEVPQILHALRPLPVAAVPGKKKRNGTANTMSTAK